MAISVGSVSVDVTPNIRGFATDLKTKLKGITANIAVTGDTTRLRESLDKATKTRVAVIRAKADTSGATAALDTAARDRTATIRANTSGLSGATRGVSGLTLAVATLGPALIPVTAAVAGLGAAFVAPLAVAGGGLTIGALIAGKAIADTKKQQKNITELAKKVQAARLAVQTASTPGGKQSALIREAAAVKAYQVALAQLTPAQKKFITAQGALKQSFRGLVSSAGGAIFGPVIKGMNLLAKVLPALKPLIVGVAGGVNTLLGDLGKAASGPGFKNFMNAFGAMAGATIVTFGRTFGNFAKGLFGLFKAFGPLSKVFVGGLSNMAKGFADWGSNVGKTKGFQSFLAYVRETGPKVAAVVVSMVKALVRIGRALAPIGALAIGGLKVLSDVIAKTPVPVLTGLAGAIISTLAALKGYQLFKAASSGLDKLSTSINGFRGADTQLSKVNVAVRGLAGAGGIGLLTASATTSNKTLGILGSAGGGALLGFGIGGPIGAAIGGGAGALLGLATQAGKVKDTLKRSIPTVADYVGSLDAVTGAATRATRASAFEALQKSGAIDAGKKFGLSSKTIVDAALGNAKALAIYNKAVNQYRTDRDALISSGNISEQGAASTAERKRLADLAGAFNTLTDAVGANSDKYKSDKAIQRDQRLAVLDLGVALKGLPDKAIKQIGLKGFPETKAQVAELAEKYKLTRGEIKTVVTVAGIPTSVREVERLKRQLDQLKSKTIFVRVKLDGKGPLKPTSPLFGPGVFPEGAGARGAIINRPTVLLAGEAGREILQPIDQTPGNAPLPGGAAAPQFKVENVYAQDVNDFLRQMQVRSRQAGIGGIPA